MMLFLDIAFSFALAFLLAFFGVTPVNAWYEAYKPLLVFVGAFVGFFAAWLLFLFITTRFVSKSKPVEKPSRFFVWLFNFLDKFVLTMCNVRVKLSGFEKLERGRTYFFVCNHRSNFDNMILASVLKKFNVIMISKPENFDIPMVGELIHKMGYMPVNRENDREALKTIVLAARKMEKGQSVLACPEGTRNHSGKGLLSFKNGVFKIAYRAKAPVSAICLTGTENIHKYSPFKPRKVYVDFLDVFEYENYCDLKTSELGDKVRDEMLEKINERELKGETWKEDLSAA